MNTHTADLHAENATIYPESIVEKKVRYPAEIEGEMGETAARYLLNSELFHLLRAFLMSRNDVAVAANMMVYYDEGNPQKWLVPDMFVCVGVKNANRHLFKTWEEGVFPQVIFEVASDETFENDLGGKRLDYARLGVEEYYLLDPEREYLPSPLMAFHRRAGRLLSAELIMAAFYRRFWVSKLLAQVSASVYLIRKQRNFCRLF